MRSTALAELDVGVVVERKATRMLAEFLWRPDGVFARKATAEPWTALEAEFASFHAGQAAIELHRTETSYCRDNLTSAAPKLWVILRPTASEPPYELLAVTADPAEGEAFTDAGSNLVDTALVPRDIGGAVVRFVARHHVERPFLKRRRQPAEAWTAKQDLRLRRAGRDGEK